MAIEHVYMFMNSSIIHDEILAHRLGLVPIMANPRMFEFMGEDGEEEEVGPRPSASERGGVAGGREGAGGAGAAQPSRRFRRGAKSRRAEGDALRTSYDHSRVVALASRHTRSAS